MLLSAENITKSYSDKMLLNGISLNIETGDKIGVIGVNGAGKSTLLEILANFKEPDSGIVTIYPDVRVEYLRQNPIFKENLTILEHVLHNASEPEYEQDYKAKSILTKLGLNDFDMPVGKLSGGQRKRAAIAAALVSPCEVLIIDEPTNHLDSDMVSWLESYLIKFTGSLIMVTHDRYFLDRVTNRIIELDKGKIYSYSANYTKYLELKAEREDMELSAERKRQSLLKKELAWISRGARARGTKSKERIARYELLSEKEGPEEKAKLNISSISSRLGKKIIEINDISKSYGERVLIDSFSYNLLRDSRIGIIGKNGCGKTTLLSIISGKLKPDRGTVVLGDTVKLGYFSQESEEMELNTRVIDYIKNISPEIETNDGTLSASQMLEKYLFPPELQWNTIGRLSGGERRRLYLLSILMQAPNVLLLDEPTNDLDIQTLTILEDYLESFKGAVISVSHDRYFLDKTADTIFEFSGDGSIKKYLGGYSDYLFQKASDDEREIVKKSSDIKTQANKTEKNKKLKLSFNEQREYETIESEIEDMEKHIASLSQQIEEHASDYIKLQELIVEKEAFQKTYDEKVERWMYLSELNEKIALNKSI